MITQLTQTQSTTSLSLNDRFTSQNSPQSTPFKIIQYVAENCLKEMITITTTGSKYPYGDLSNETKPTSCIHTSCMIASLLLGTEKARTLYQMLRVNNYTDISDELSSGKNWKFRLSNIFDGVLLARAHKDNIDLLKITPNELSIVSLKYIEDNVNEFYDRIEPGIDTLKLHNCSEAIVQKVSEEFFKKIDYECNFITIQMMKDEISQNESKISSTNSCIYFISITDPDTEIKNGKEHNITKMKIEHEFIIEQFYKDNDTVGYRFYQSMIEQATLTDHIKNFSYGDKGENSWDKNDLLKFLKSLSDVYTINKHTKTSNAYKACFGYEPQKGLKKKLLTFDQSIFSAVSLRYISQHINPQDTIKHLSQIIESNSELQKFF